MNSQGEKKDKFLPTGVYLETRNMNRGRRLHRCKTIQVDTHLLDNLFNHYSKSGSSEPEAIKFKGFR